MKSVEITEESYVGIPADVEAFTAADEAVWFDSKDIGCQPAVIATLKGLRAAVPVTAVAVKGEDGADVASGTELSIAAGAKLLVHAVRTPVYSAFPCTWASADSTKVKVTKIDDSSALIEPVAANASAVAVTVTGSAGVTASVSVKPVV